MQTVLFIHAEELLRILQRGKRLPHIHGKCFRFKGDAKAFQLCCRLPKGKAGMGAFHHAEAAPFVCPFDEDRLFAALLFYGTKGLLHLSEKAEYHGIIGRFRLHGKKVTLHGDHVFAAVMHGKVTEHIIGFPIPFHCRDTGAVL